MAETAVEKVLRGEPWLWCCRLAHSRIPAVGRFGYWLCRRRG